LQSGTRDETSARARRTSSTPARETASVSNKTYRHPLPIRLTHWVNAVALTLLLASGLQIFNAHPALYLGDASDFDRPLLAIGATGAAPDRGYVRAFGRKLDTTGVLGVSGPQGETVERAFPAWATVPADQDLATGRRWHFLFAWIFIVNGLGYLLFGLFSGQLRRRLIPTGAELAGLGASLREHLTLRFPQGEAATRYNVIQKLTYLAVVLVLLPLQWLAGVAMSPGYDAFAPWLAPVFGGRQSARTVHFAIASLLVLFVVVHVAMVMLSGPFNSLRGMITGWFAIRAEKEPT
jgi:thiosulfate reductase cytochrome b subunit